MVIVAGHIVVDPQERDEYLSGCVEVVRQARRAAGCLDFAISADPVEPGRVNIFERWESQLAVDESAAILAASVAEYDVESQPTLM